MTVKIKAKKVRRGHSIPGLDNAYVVDVRKDGHYAVEFTFHDTNGEEGTLNINVDQWITVDQTEPQWVGGY